jgi:hypothetical protein
LRRWAEPRRRVSNRDQWSVLYRCSFEQGLQLTILYPIRVAVVGNPASIVRGSESRIGYYYIWRSFPSVQTLKTSDSSPFNIPNFSCFVTYVTYGYEYVNNDA